MEKQNTSIYELELHESIAFKIGQINLMKVIRVPSGWLYILIDPNSQQAKHPIFVPEPMSSILGGKEHWNVRKVAEDVNDIPGVNEGEGIKNTTENRYKHPRYF